MIPGSSHGSVNCEFTYDQGHHRRKTLVVPLFRLGWAKPAPVIHSQSSSLNEVYKLQRPTLANYTPRNWGTVSRERKLDPRSARLALPGTYCLLRFNSSSCFLAHVS